MKTTKQILSVIKLTLQSFANGQGFSSRKPPREVKHTSSGITLKISHYNPKVPQLEGMDTVFESGYDSVTWAEMVKTFGADGCFVVVYDDGSEDALTLKEFSDLDSATLPDDCAYLQAQAS